MQLFSQKYAVILKIMQLLCTYAIRFIKGISIMVIFNCFPLNKCFHNCIFYMRIKFMQESEV